MYSLRSLEKHATGVRDVWIIGSRLPDWMDPGSVRFLDVPDDPKSISWKNVWNKMRAAAREPEISDRFACMMDDIMLTLPVHLPDFPALKKTWGFPACGSSVSDRWTASQAATLRALRECGFRGTPGNFENHAPLIVRKAWIMSMDLSTWDDSPLFVQWRTMYCNLHGIKGKPARDMKCLRLWGSDSIDRFIKSAGYFSMCNENLGNGVEEWLEREFPGKSRWEK